MEDPMTTSAGAAGEDYEEVQPGGGWYIVPDNASQQQYWDGAKWVGSRRSDISNARPFPGTQRVRRDELYEDVPTPADWYARPSDPSHEQYWTGDQWVGKARTPRHGAKPTPFPGPVQRVQRGATPRSASNPQLNEDGTKTCPMCAETVQGAALVCRFCGHRFDGRQEPVAPGETSTSGAAVAAFICSLVGLWIAGIPLGIHAQRQIDQSGGRKTGRGFATAGIILGIIGIIGTIVLVIVLVSAAKHTSSCTLTYRSTGECVPGT
jgi:Domain of unknown function (DUF4190)/Uncharacterised protein family UPF0547